MKTPWSAILVLAGLTAPSLSAQWPSVLPMSPSSGSGTSYFFQFASSDPQGYADIYYTEMLINSSFQAAGGCYFYYHRASNVMYLSADNGIGWVGSAALGSAGTLQNSQCSLNLPTSSATGSGNNLNVTLALTFKPAFAGTRTWYSTVEDVSGHWAGWHTTGTWTVPDPNQVPSVLPMSPSSGSGTSQTFQFPFSDPQGYANISYTEMLMNTSFQGAWGCYFYYQRASNLIYLLADNGSGWVGSAALGSAGTLENSQCSLSLPSSSATGAGNNLTIYLALTFKPAFVGTKNWYATVEDNGGLWAGWSAIGTWTIPAAPPPTITTSSPLPNGTVGVAYSQTLTATGGTPPYSWSVISGSLPPGLTLSSGGVLSGTPTTANTYNFTVQVSGGGTSTKAFSLTIAAPPLTITTGSPLPNGTVGVAYSLTFTATGGTPPYTWSVISGSLPPGLSLSSGGVLSGTPTTANTHNFTVQVSGGGTASKAFSLTIGGPPFTNAVGGTNFGIHDFPNGYIREDNVHTWNPIKGSINNYHHPSVRAEVDNHLLAMRQNDQQQRLRVFLWHKRGAQSPSQTQIVGTVLNSTGGLLDPQAHSNLLNVLTKMRDLGYAEVLVTFGPVGHNFVGPWEDRNANGPPQDLDADGIPSSSFTRPPGCNPTYPGDADGDGIDDIDSLPFPCHDLWRGSVSQWTTTGPDSNEAFFEENWNLIANLYPAITNIPGLIVKVDLGNEYTVELDAQAERYEAGHYQDVLYHKYWGKRAYYMKRMWSNFVGTFGRTNAVGFSFETGASMYDSDGGSDPIQRKIRGAYQIYDSSGLGRPVILSFHFYDGIGGLTPGQQFSAVHSSLNGVGATTEGIIIGECFYNDAFTADSLIGSGVPRTIWYLTQWFYQKSPFGAVDTNGGPYDFSNYRARGF